jgi:hypothetical protein
MAVLDKAAFEALYGTSGTTFPDNTTGEISEGDMRQFGKDIADSLFNPPIGEVQYTVLNIGDWDMDANNFTVVNHGIADFTKIRSVNVIIRDDAGTNHYTVLQGAATGASAWITQISSTQITLEREAAGDYDNTGFDSTTYNRGWITIGYVS